jgi:hypothetical protein
MRRFENFGIAELSNSLAVETQRGSGTFRMRSVDRGQNTELLEGMQGVIGLYLPVVPMVPSTANIFQSRNVERVSIGGAAKKFGSDVHRYPRFRTSQQIIGDYEFEI